MMKTFRISVLFVCIFSCLTLLSCKDDDSESYLTAKENAAKIEQYGLNTAFFYGSGLSGEVHIFKIELPFITFDRSKTTTVSLPLENLLNITYVGDERRLILYFE